MMNESEFPLLDMIPHSDRQLIQIENTIDNDDHNQNQENETGQAKRRRCRHRHTPQQIQEMEAFFKQCPHPDEGQRKDLGLVLGLDPLQVKFWFQNKRTQLKAQHERHENSQLRVENERIRAENLRFKEALNNICCPTCGPQSIRGDAPFDEQQFKLENARLKEEIERISGIAAKYAGKNVLSNTPGPLSSVAPHESFDAVIGNLIGQTSPSEGHAYGTRDLLRSIMAASVEIDKTSLVELAISAMEELIRMAQIGEPLWSPNVDRSSVVLNEDEYIKLFPGGAYDKPNGFRTEASRESVYVVIDALIIIGMLMDVTQWSNAFAGIVSRATTLEVLATGGTGIYNGTFQLMTAEYQVPSPLVPTRESYFLRHSKQLADGSWAIVDVSLDGLYPSSLVRCRKRPSGCLIQEMSGGLTKVTWVEHVQVDDKGIHNIYKPLVNAGLAFGAKRWVAILSRQSERIMSLMLTHSIPTNSIISTAVFPDNEGKRNMFKLAERMVLSFCSGVSASTAHTWTTLSGGNGVEEVKVMTRTNTDDAGRPLGVVLSAATSFWLPIPPKKVYDFLINLQNREKWDILSNSGNFQEFIHIATNRESSNCLSVFRINSSSTSQSKMVVLQECNCDPTGSFVIYAPVDATAMNILLAGGSPDLVQILPSGFAILPDGPTGPNDGYCGPATTGGTLLTAGFQILVDGSPTAKLSVSSVTTVAYLIVCTVSRLRAALSEAPAA